MKAFLHSKFKAAAEYVLPVQTTSTLRHDGKLTPEEFVAAGDALVFKCPTWSWEGCSDPNRRNPHFPNKKQYLITRNDTNGDESIPSMDGSALSETKAVAVAEPVAVTANAEEEEVPDMDEYVDNGVIEDDEATLSADLLRAVEPEDNILHTRTYDITITWDKYYAVPRIWLFGYDEHRTPLRSEQIFEDVIQDHANKTVQESNSHAAVLPQPVTAEMHPFIPYPHASVHPCNHSNVMKKIIAVLSQRGAELQADNYMFIFLKFIASVVPTIEYDYTVHVDMNPNSGR
eukprot:jgi/Chlat1/1969/Chrsp158S02310